jgi:hypothetical protein
VIEKCASVLSGLPKWGLKQELLKSRELDDENDYNDKNVEEDDYDLFLKTEGINDSSRRNNSNVTQKNVHQEDEKSIEID